jgi:hypothetical protein
MHFHTAQKPIDRVTILYIQNYFVKKMTKVNFHQKVYSFILAAFHSVRTFLEKHKKTTEDGGAKRLVGASLVQL